MPKVTAANLDALNLDRRERRFAELAPLEQHVLQRGAVEIALAHPAVAEDDAFELRESQAGEVEAALGEHDVLQRRLGQLGTRQPAAQEFDPKRGEANRPAVRPILVCSHDIDERFEVELVTPASAPASA